jgi:hypothetical protein
VIERTLFEDAKAQRLKACFRGFLGCAMAEARNLM